RALHVARLAARVADAHGGEAPRGRRAAARAVVLPRHGARAAPPELPLAAGRVDGRGDTAAGSSGGGGGDTGASSSGDRRHLARGLLARLVEETLRRRRRLDDGLLPARGELRLLLLLLLLLLIVLARLHACRLCAENVLGARQRGRARTHPRDAAHQRRGALWTPARNWPLAQRRAHALRTLTPHAPVMRRLALRHRQQRAHAAR